MSKRGDKAARRALYKQSVKGGGGGVKTACGWKDANEEELKALKNAPFEMVDTSYGCYEAKQQRNVMRACRKMMPTKREDLRQGIDEMDTPAAAAAANTNENEPTHITPF